MLDQYDIAVIGAGPGGSRVAERCAAAGKSVVVVEAPPVGGTCARVGCNPKKVLAEAVRFREQLRGHGRLLEPPLSGEVQLDWSRLHAWQVGFTDPVADQKRDHFSEAGIDFVEGTARFVSPVQLQVEYASGETRPLEADRFVVATGSEPRRLPFENADHLAESDAFFTEDELPGKLVFVGGGYIAFELAQVAAAVGREVLVLEAESRCLRHFDAELTARLVEATQDQGIEVRTEIAIDRLLDDGSQRELWLADGERIVADWVINSAGRVPLLGPLAPAAGGITLGDRGGVVADDCLRSVSNGRVYAVGDCLEKGAPALASVANRQGRALAENLIRGESTAITMGAIAEVVFTIPRLARVTTGRQIDHEREGVRVHRGGWDKSGFVRKWAGQELPCGYVFTIDHHTDRLLAGEILHPLAEEMINLLVSLIQSDQRLTDFTETVFAYPTAASQLQSAIRSICQDAKP